MDCNWNWNRLMATWIFFSRCYSFALLAVAVGVVVGQDVETHGQVDLGRGLWLHSDRRGPRFLPDPGEWDPTLPLHLLDRSGQEETAVAKEPISFDYFEVS